MKRTQLRPGNYGRYAWRHAMLGSYRGVRWVRSRHCDMFPFQDRLLRSEWYFVCGSDGEPTGDHFRTRREMEDWIDSEQ